MIFNKIRGWLIIDLVSIIPFDLVVSENSQSLRILRLFRLIKIREILDLKKIMFIVEKIGHGSTNEKLIIMSSLVYFYKVIRLLIVGICITYAISGLWYGIINVISIDQGFPINFKLDNATSAHKYYNSYT